MDSEQKDFKAVKVQMKSSQKQGDQLSRSMLYSGINIFGQLSQIYLQNKDSGSSFQAIQSSMGKSGDSGDQGSMMNLNQEVLAIFKRLQKKDSTTKIKAFQELDRYVDSQDGSSNQLLNQSMQSEEIQNAMGSSQQDEMQSLLTFFLYHFCRIIMNEPDKKVREAAHMSFSVFIKKAKRRLGPHLKRIFSLWFCSFFDVSQEVSNLARKNFEAAFPENKRDQVFKIAYKNFLHFANEQLKQSEDQISDSVAELSKAQREDVFDRITSSVLQALAKSFDFIKEWPDEEKEHFIKKLIDILDLTAPLPQQSEQAVEEEQKKAVPVKKQQVPQSYLWGFLQPKCRGRVRASCLMFISNLLVNLPKDVIDTHISQLSPLVYGLIGEDNSSLQATLWRDALFTLGKNFPISWESTNIKKNFLPKLYTCLKASAFGAPTALYENFVKFVSIFPLYHLIDYTEDKINKASFKERCNLLRETLTTLYQGLKNDESVAFHQDLIKCYFETFSFIVLKRVQPLILSDKVSQEDKDFCIAQLKKCVQVPLEDFLTSYEKMNSKVQNQQRNIRYTITSQIAKMLKDLADREVDKRIFQSILDFMSESINLTPEKPNVMRLFNGLLKGSMSRETSYFKDHLLQGYIWKFIESMQKKVVEDTEILGKENIESLSQRSLSLYRVLYKLNKFQVNCDENKVAEIAKVTMDIFAKVAKKLHMAKNVLSSEFIQKFKAIKVNILKSAILAQNLLCQDLLQSFHAFINVLLFSQTIDPLLKVKVLLPGQEMKKINFRNYYQVLNQKSAHDIVIDFILNHIIADETNIHRNWTLVDSGLQLLREQNKQSFILPEDQSVIAQAITMKISSLKSSDFLSFQHYFSSIKSLLMSKDDESYEYLRQLLFDKLLIIKSTHPSFAVMWAIYSPTLKSHLTKNGQERTAYFQYCITKLKEELQTINKQKADFSRKGAAQFDAINRFTLMVKSFVQLLPQGSQDRQNVIEEILLQESTFTSNLEDNCLPLKMFRDLFLSGGLGGFDVTKLFSDSKYVWLAAVLLNARHLKSLANFIEMKKQLVIFVDTEVIPTLISQAQGSNSKIIIDIIQYMSDKAKDSIDYVYSIEQFVMKLIDPGEEFPVEEKPVIKIDAFKTIFHIVSEHSQTVINTTGITFSNEIHLFLRVLRQIAYYIMDEPFVQQMYQRSVETLKTLSIKAFDQRDAINIEIFQALNQYFKITIGNEPDELTKSLLITVIQSVNSASSIDPNILNAILNFVSHSLDQMGVYGFTKIVLDSKVNFQAFLNWIIEAQRKKNLQPLTYIYLLSIIRKTIHSKELINDQKLLVDQVIEIAKDHALRFDAKVNRVQELVRQAQSIDEKQVENETKKKKRVAFQGASEDQDESGDEEEKYMLSPTTRMCLDKEDIQMQKDEEIEDFEHEMLQEAAETMLSITNFVQPSISENDLFILIGSGVESLQKAAFVLLKYLYENYIPLIRFKIDDNDMVSQVKQEVQEAEKEDKEAKEAEEEKGGEHFHHHEHQKVKNRLAFRNISDALIEILENPPTVGDDGQVHSQHIISSSTHVEQLIFEDTHHQDSEVLINSKVFGYFMAWNALLIKIENGRIKSQLQGNNEYSQVLGALNEYLEENDGIYRMFLVNLLAYLPEEKRGLQDAYNVSNFSPEYVDLSEKKASSLLTVYTLLNFMKSFPSLARKYYQECDKQLLDLVLPYIKQIVSPAILENEIKKIELAQLQLGQNELTFSLFKSTKEILASFSKGEIQLTLKIKIPADYPMKLVEVDVSRQIKISEKQLRKWILAIRKIIQFQNGDIISAVLAWKANIEREIEGIEDCYICYCVVHETDQSLPKMPCKTCKNKFHVACIRKWFRQSHKSNCPICQNYFF